MGVGVTLPGSSWENDVDTSDRPCGVAQLGGFLPIGDTVAPLQMGVE